MAPVAIVRYRVQCSKTVARIRQMITLYVSLYIVLRSVVCSGSSGVCDVEVMVIIVAC